MSSLLEVFGQGMSPSTGACLGLGEWTRHPGDGSYAGRERTSGSGILERTLDRAFDSFRRGRWNEAARCFERALALEDECLSALLGLACCCDHLGRAPDCIRWLDRAAVVDAHNGPLQLARGQWSERTSRFADARACYEAALQADERLAPAHLRLAAMHLAVGRYAGAAAHYREVHRIAPENSSYALALAHLLLADGNIDEAIDYFERAITIEPDTWQANDDLADGLERAGRLEEAIEHLEHAVESQPTFADTHLRLGDLYAKRGCEQTALKHYLRAVEIHPGYLEATVKVGTHHLRHGRYLESAGWFNRGVAINDRLLSAYCGLAYAHLQAGHDDGASAGLEMAAAIEPNSTLLLSEVARLQLRIRLMDHEAETLDLAPADDPVAIMDGLVDAQIERLEHIGRLRPNHAELHYNLGMLLRHRGRSDEAIERFNRTVQINPLFAKAHINLAIIHCELGNGSGAREHLERAFTVTRDDLATFYSLALLALDPARMERAAARFEMTLRREPAPADFVANLHQALRTMGLNGEKATECVFRVWELAEAPAERPMPPPH